MISAVGCRLSAFGSIAPAPLMQRDTEVEIASGAWQPPGTHFPSAPGACRVVYDSSQCPSWASVPVTRDPAPYGRANGLGWHHHNVPGFAGELLTYTGRWISMFAGRKGGKKSSEIPVSRLTLKKNGPEDRSGPFEISSPGSGRELRAECWKPGAACQWCPPPLKMKPTSRPAPKAMITAQSP